ncbi:MAG: inositol monophosphatase [Candidatus Staskawiczbacteria bacterium]|nr:inositol monophosphatase [Candidatus Staskawiczbacteria bacterium]
MENDIVLQTMIRAAIKAGNILKKMFISGATVGIEKGNNYYDIVSKADIASEGVIIKILINALPNIKILSEEKGFIDNQSQGTIVIDPLDGSSNFLLGMPHFSVAMAYVEDGQILASVVYNPVMKKMYTAQKGKGAFLNGKKLVSGEVKNLQHIAVNFSHQATWKEKRLFFDKIYASGTSRVMNNWSPNLDFCLLAENKIDVVVSKDSLLYDFAPGLLIAKESGCFEFPSIEKVNVNVDAAMSFVVANSKTLSAKLHEII